MTETASEADANVQFLVNGRPVEISITFHPGNGTNETLSIDCGRSRTRNARWTIGQHANFAVRVTSAQSAVAVSAT